MLEITFLIMVSVTPGDFFQPGKNALSLKPLAWLSKTPSLTARHRGVAELRIRTEYTMSRRGARV